MNPPTTSDDAQMDSSLPQTISSTPSALQSIPKGHGRIIRDDLGNVVSIELSEEQDVEPPFDSGVQTMQQLEPGMDKNLRETWVTELGGADDKRVVTQDGKNVVAGEPSSCSPSQSRCFRHGDLSSKMIRYCYAICVFASYVCVP